MSTIIIKKIGARSILSDSDYQYILDNLNKPLPLMSVNYTFDGKIFGLAVYNGDSNCVTLFVETNKLDYTIVSPVDKIARVLAEREEIIKNIHNFDKGAYVHGLMDGRIEEIRTLLSIVEDMRK